MTGEFSNSFDHGKYFKTGLTFSKILMNSLYNVHIYKSSFFNKLLYSKTGQMSLVDTKQIDCLEMSIGEVLRHGLYGSKEYC